MSRVTVAIVSYNSGALLRRCVSSLLAQTDPALFDLVVIDNGSSDDSCAELSRAFPQVNLREQGCNLGFAAAVNLAFEGAETPYLFCLNPDAEIKTRALERLLDFAELHPEASIWGGRTVFEDGTLNPTNCQRRIGLWSVLCQTVGLSGAFPNSALFNPDGYGGWLRDDTRAVDVVTGCAMLISRDLWDKLDGFDTRFFMYGEEHDFCLRAGALGAQPMVTHTAEFIHHQSQSYTHLADMWVHLLCAKITLAQRHLSPLRAWLSVLCLRLYPYPRLIAFWLAGVLNQKYAPRAAVWAEVRARWEEWHDGY